MTNCKVSKITHDDKLSHGLKIETPKGEIHMVPVIDVRDGQDERDRIKRVIKSTNRSSFLHPSFGEGGGSYQASYKK